MISEQTIHAVRDASIVDVVGRYVQLKHRGVSYTGLCPFHNEKSGSFSVNETKGMYKCFGCGVGGDVIDFIQRIEKVEFIAAIELIAGMVGVPIEYEEIQNSEKWEQTQAIKAELKQVLRFAVDRYRNNLWHLPDEHPVMAYLQARNITREVIADWQLGWATEEWRHLAPDLINKGWYEQGNKLGLVKRSQSGDSNYDGYRSRITIPILDRHGEPVGMGGRFLLVDQADKDKSQAKYINSPDNELYNKSLLLYALSKAQRGIARAGFTFLVEGYFDAISLHANNDDNAVATCGTALTPQQAVLLKKYTNHVVVLRDGDDAGRKAAVKDLLILLQEGFKVDVALLPDGDDPDDYTRKLVSNHYLAGKVEFFDAVYWQVSMLMKYVNNDEFQLGKAKEAVLSLLTKIPNALIRNNYFDTIVKKYKWNRTALQKQLIEMVELQESEDDEIEGDLNLKKLPRWMDKEEFLQQGYCSVKNKKIVGYYSFGSSGQVQITNFLIKPLFHIYAGKESRHMIQIENIYKTAVLDIESKALISPDLLAQYVVCEGAFVIYGSKAQMLRIATNLLSNFPRCIEIKFLGWQAPGFFAFVDKIYMPGKGILELDEWGIFKVEENNYLVPAASAAYKELQSTGDDPYEQDRVLTFVKTSTTFSEWAILMNRVYKEKGPVGIAFVILSLFRDIVFEIDNNCPHLYGFGERSSGKSKWAESILAAFFVKRSAFNLNSGTDFAFFSYMQRYINCPAALNEFDDKVIKPEWFQAIKGVFDGEGRQRGVMGSKNKTEIMKIRSTLVLTGQYLCTQDDNSIVTRSIIEAFSERELTENDKVNYDKLKRLEEAGISSILTELLQHREIVKENFRALFNETLSSWRRTVEGEFNQRIMQNWCHLYTAWRVISQKIQLPVSDFEFEAYCKQNALKWSSFIRTTDTLSEFWNTLAFLVDQGYVVDGWDYKIVEVTEIPIRKGSGEEYTHQFNEPTKVIYIRMNNIHKHYQQAYRSRTGKEGMTMENLMHYFSARKYYLGNSRQSRFKRFTTVTENVTRYGPTNVVTPETHKKEESTVTSSHVFVYNMLGLDLERVSADEMTVPVESGFKPVEGADFNSKPSENGEYQKIPFPEKTG